MDIPPGNLVVGTRQSKRLLASGEAAKVYVARDAAPHVTMPVVELCDSQGVAVEYIDSKKMLGKLCNIDVDASVVVVKK